MRKIKDEHRYFDDSLVMLLSVVQGPCLLSSLEGWTWKASGYLSSVPVILRYGIAQRGLSFMAVNVHTHCHIGIEYKRFYPEYCGAINGRGVFDIVIIDGEWRDECTEYALKALIPGGLLIIDNYKQPSVQAHGRRLKNSLRGKQITLFKEPDHADWVTAVIVV